MSEETTNRTESLQVRVLNHFGSIEEKEFWPSDITNAKDTLTGPLTFKEFEELMTSNQHRTINNINRRITDYTSEYKQYINDVNSTPNVFSYDVDYI